MASRHRLQEAMELLASKKQKEHEQVLQWTSTKNYFHNWERHNNKFSEWTSDQYYHNSTAEYNQQQTRKEKQKKLDERREKLRKLFDQENMTYGLEMTESPRTKQGKKPTDLTPPTNLLKDIHLGIKLAEEDRRKHEAEMKLYYQWRNDHPIIRDYERNQQTSDLKLAWLDQQIEKRMAQEKMEEESRKMFQDRQRLLHQQEELEKAESEQQLKKEKELLERINQHLKYYKDNQVRQGRLEEEEEAAKVKSGEIDELLQKKEAEVQRRRQKDLVVYNLGQSKMKLRRKALEVEEELKREKELMSQVERLKVIEELESEEEKKKAKVAMDTYMKYVQELQKIEKQRQQFISFMFDSEAKVMWQKQERLWREEQETRDKLFKNVLYELKEQVQERILRNNRRKQLLEEEKAEALRALEENEKILKEQKEELKRKKFERKCELDRQVNEKVLIENERKLKEEKERLEELECIKKEEERLKNELLMMQRGKYHPRRYQRRTMFW